MALNVLPGGFNFAHRTAIVGLVSLSLGAPGRVVFAGGGDSGRGVTLIQRSVGLDTPQKEEGNSELELADFDGDGHLDLVSVGDHGSPYINSTQHGIMVWLGDGAGVWTVHQSGNFGYGGVAAGDLNLDGVIDLAWGIHHDNGSAGFGDRLLGAALGNGTGASWTPWGSGLATSGETWGMFSTALADFDGNGLLDTVSLSFGGGNGVRLYENHGDGTWSQVWAQTGGSVGFTIETCDVNADGNMDIVATRVGTNVYLGDGSFGFTLAQSGLPTDYIHGLHTGDVTNDGRQELVFANGFSGVRCYRFEDSSSSWVSISNGLPTTGTYYLTQLGDLNRDGFEDIVAYSDPTGTVFLGDGGASWTADATWTMPSPGHSSALRVNGDVDHDGREDIAILAVKSGFPFYRNQLRVYSPWLAPTALETRITEPRGGEAYRSGSIREIRWLTAVPVGQGAASVDLELSLNGSAGPWIPLATDLPDNGRYQWSVSSAGSNTCRIRVTATTLSDAHTAISPADFRILGDAAPGTGFCFGDPGSGTPCPCSNDNDGSVPGSGCANGLFASGAQLTGSGAASVSADSLVLTATHLEPSNAGLYFQARNQINNGDGILFGDGLRCAGTEVVRLEVRFADASGTSSTTIGISAKAGNVSPGDTKRYQCWYRNPSGSPCGSDFNLSNGYQVAWLP